MRFLVTSAILVAAGALTGPMAQSPAPPSAGAWTWRLPDYVPAPRVPADNPMSESKFQLGRHLFYDKRLSGNGTLACASCHLQERAFTDGRSTSAGSTGEHTPRNAPSVANVAWHATYTWANPALVTLERQAEVPLYGEHPIEMGVTDTSKAEILTRLAAEPKYLSLFEAAFPDRPDPISFDSIVKAIAVFERGVISFGSRYDLYLQGRAQITESEQRGLNLFFGERGECHHCHGSPNFNDQFVHSRTRELAPQFHNTGLYDLDGKGAFPYPNRGVFELSGDPRDMGRFRAPSLRNVAVTSPYMHDGSVASLEEVIDIYSNGGRNVTDGPFAGDGRINPLKSDLIVRIALSEAEKTDLLAFLRTLTDDSLLTAPRFADPWKPDAASSSVGSQP